MKVLTFFILISLSYSKSYEEGTICRPINIDKVFKIKSATTPIYDRERVKSETMSYLDVKEFKQLRIFFASALYLPESNSYLVVNRVQLNDHSSVLYASFFDEDWKQVLTPSTFQSLHLPGIIPIPVVDYSILFSGPEDPRIFRGLKNKIFIIFNILEGDKIRRMKLLSVADFKIITMKLDNYFLGVPNMEKNWAPIVTPSNLYYFYNYKSFEIVECSHRGICSHVSGKYSTDQGKIKPGTVFVRFEDTNYYFSFSYRHLSCKGSWIRYYRPVFTLLYVTPQKFTNIITSSVSFLFEKLSFEPFTDVPSKIHEKDYCKRETILIISSIVKFDSVNDETEVLGFVNDFHTFQATLKGIGKFVRKIIEDYEGKYYRLN